MSNGRSSITPAKVYVRFRGRRCNGTASDSVPKFYEKVIDNLALDGHDGIEDSYKIFHDTAIALFNVGSTDPTNKAALDALASQIADDYINWITNVFDESYPGIVSPILDGLTDTIEWEYRRDRCITRRYSSPYNDYPEEMMHHDPANVDCKDSGSTVVSQTPCIYFYGPPSKCVSGKPQLTRYKVCMVGGLLIQEYVSTDTVT